MGESRTIYIKTEAVLFREVKTLYIYQIIERKHIFLTGSTKPRLVIGISLLAKKYFLHLNMSGKIKITTF